VFFFVVFLLAVAVAAVSLRGGPALAMAGAKPAVTFRSAPPMPPAPFLAPQWASRPSRLESSRLAWWLTGSILFLVVGLREGTTDYGNYIDLFRRLADESGWMAATNAFRDPGWGALNYLVSQIWNEPRALFLVVAGIAVGTTMYCYRRMAPYFFVAVLGYITWSFPKDIGQIRNGLCSTLVLFALFKLYERRAAVWAATIGLAASIHGIGLIGFCAPLCRRLGESRLLVGALLFGVLAAILGGVGEWSAQLIARTDENWATGALAPRIYSYLGSEEKALEPYRLFGGSMSLTLLLASVVLFWRQHLEAMSRYNTLLIPVVVYGSVLFLLFRDFPTLAFRIRDTLVEPLEPILLSSLVAAGFSWQRPLLFVGVVGYCGLWYFSGLLSSGYRYEFALIGGG
jgi:hypothetical protein